MPTTDFTIGITALPEDDTFTAEMEGIGVRLDTLVPVYTALYAAFRKIEQARFDAEGPGWEELAESTVAKRGSAHPILNETGKMRRSLTTAGAPGAVVEPIPDGLFMGTDMMIAAVHQHGTDRAGRDHTTRIPARPLVDMREQDADVFAEIVGGYVYEHGLSASADVFAVDSEGL